MSRESTAGKVDANELGYECYKCGNYYNRKESRDRHLRTVHSDARPFKCTFCDRRFNLQANCNRHEKVVHDKDGFRTMMYGSSVIYECDICGKGFTRKESRRRHYIIHTGDQPYPCRYCDLSFNISGNRRRHEQTQHEQKATETVVEDGIVEEEEEPHVQVPSKLGPRLFGCDLCGLKFPDHLHLDQHRDSIDCQMQRNTQVFTEIIGADSDMTEQLGSVRKNRSGKTRRPEENQTRFGCGYCNKTFKLPLSCLRHEMKVHHITPD